jgi:chondroitin-sulfate-ABC endolyase/exolyase
MNSFKKYIPLFISLLCAWHINPVFSQSPVDVCEGQVPVNWQTNNGTLSLSTNHYKLGTQSVLWNWNNKSAVLSITDTSFKNAINNIRSGFAIWIYNDTPVKDSLIFQFVNGVKTNCSFSFQLNYKGWRTAWVMYHRDMKGKPATGMNTLLVNAPKAINNGTLFFDHVVYNTGIDPRGPMRDVQVPFVNVNGDKAANAHWTSLLSFNQHKHYLAKPVAVTSIQQSDIQTIHNRYEEIILKESPVGKKQLLFIDSAFQSYQIKRDGNNISGKPVSSINAYEIADELPLADARKWARLYGIQDASELLLKIAMAWHSNDVIAADKNRLVEMFIALLDHLHNQGWAYGSGMGSLHHIGYFFQDYFPACLLMKQVLKENNLLQRTQKDMEWFSGLGRTRQRPDLLPLANIDVFNTLLGGMLASVLIMDNSTEKLLQLTEYSNWLSKNIGPEYSIDGTFKPGGSITHHGTLYPAYAIGGLNGLTPIIYTLSNTSFEVTPKAYNVVKESLLKMHYYTNPLYWPISVAGRHPTGNWKIADQAYAYMALAGGSQKFDSTMASIYLRIINNNKRTSWASDFLNRGVKIANFPTGHWDMNYGLLSIHRRTNWLLTVRGHNRYFVSHESYPGANVYGRYLTYGNLELMYPNNTDNNGSYFKDEGWDWNNIPGTTTLHLPLEKLKANIVNADDFSGVEEMLLTDEIFCGGSSLENQGIYAMKLHGHDKYTMGSFRAIKSWFMFDSLVICLGSNITNNITGYETQTTLFQNYISDTSAAVLINTQSITTFPCKQKLNTNKPVSVIDNRGSAYYLAKGGKIEVTKERQQSRNQQDTKNTTGTFTKAIINHGFAPSSESYEYAMLINSANNRLQQFQTTMIAEPVYKVLQQDSAAHILYYLPQQITALALFRENSNCNDSFIVSTSRPALVMYHKSEKLIALSVTDPDLGFYNGSDDTPILPDGKRKEVSIYSKKWYGTAAKPSVVKLTLKGKWRFASQNKNQVIKFDKAGNSILSVTCSNAEPIIISLQK